MREGEEEIYRSGRCRRDWASQTRDKGSTAGTGSTQFLVSLDELSGHGRIRP